MKTKTDILDLFPAKKILDNSHGVSQELAICSITHEELETALFMPFQVDHFLLIAVQKGTVQVRANLIDYPIATNCTFLATPNVIYEFTKSENNSVFILLRCSLSLLYKANLNQKHIQTFIYNSKVNIAIYQLSEAQIKKVSTRIAERNERALL